MAQKKARMRIVRVVLVILAVIGGITVVDNTYRLGRAVVSTIAHFDYHPTRVVSK